MPLFLKGRSATFLFAITMLATLHFPFLNADPPLNFSFSRDACTDEGLYALQIRNLIQTGSFKLDEAPTFLVSPLFGAFLFPVLSLSNSLFTARICVLLFFLIVVYISFSSNPWALGVGWFFLTVGLLQFHLFHYSHFALSEFFSIGWIVISNYFLVQWVSGLQLNKRKTGHFLIAVVFNFLAFLGKFQYVYLLFLPFMVSCFLLVFLRPGPEIFRRCLKDSLLAFGVLIVLGFCYWIIWFSPNQPLFLYILRYVNNTYTFAWQNLWELISFHYEKEIFPPMGAKFFFWLFMSSIPVSIWVLRKRKSLFFFAFSVINFSWILLESHKLTYEYLPSRYLVSFLTPMALQIAACGFECYRWIKAKAHKFRMIYWLFTGLLFLGICIQTGINFYSMAVNFQERKFETKSANRYLADFKWNGEMVIGSWAPAITWGLNCYPRPVWVDYFNPGNPLKNFQPRAIICEPDEFEGLTGYKSEPLPSWVDSSRKFTIHHDWPLEIYWISRVHPIFQTRQN